MDWHIGGGKYFGSNNTVWLETLAMCFHRSLENILLILAPQLSQQQCVKTPWPMARIQESHFYMPAKKNFLATEMMPLSHFALWSEGIKKMKQKARDCSYS